MRKKKMERREIDPANPPPDLLIKAIYPLIRYKFLPQAKEDYVPEGWIVRCTEPMRGIGATEPILLVTAIPPEKTWFVYMKIEPSFWNRHAKRGIDPMTLLHMSFEYHIEEAIREHRGHL